MIGGQTGYEEGHVRIFQLLLDAYRNMTTAECPSLFESNARATPDMADDLKQLVLNGDVVLSVANQGYSPTSKGVFAMMLLSGQNRLY